MRPARKDRPRLHRCGPNDILDKLRGSINAEQDRQRFLTAQLLFWMLAAPDGHAKNSSIRLLAGGAFALTPLYDVMSAWPVIDKGPRQLQWQKIRLAMAARSKNAHYRMQDIQRWHWNAFARRNAMGENFEAVIEDVLTRTPGVTEDIGARLPPGFPMHVAEAIFEGLLLQAKPLASAAPAGD